ncbi:hypothetical protein QEG98_34130 [Myxococcus sp. MxC21-1]|uniref:hypothetical protein n=1 Tax=Myxococcus sp. MxC21-1 TaxID=3041439 RepID=UPI00292FC5B0|nr:hypothetical protein [Myxococcus sp. MxC21-1]WNZ60916.1 hypothetical protein QEG98_34130 [Myxococcus sp. MxC21-1]
MAATIILPLNAQADQGTHVTRTWFADTNCTSLVINQYNEARDKRAARTLTITDGQFVRSLVSRIEQLPTEGDKLISFAPTVRRVELVFTCGEGARTLELYQHRIKTPATSFFSQSSELETRLDDDIEALLAPALGTIIPKVKGLELRFDGFSVTFTGVSSSPPAPVTVSTCSDEFLIDTEGKPQQRLRITSGQRPPAPQTFMVGASTRTLLTYETKSKHRLHPHAFQITK